MAEAREPTHLIASGPVLVRVSAEGREVTVSDEHGMILHLHDVPAVLVQEDDDFSIVASLEEPAAN